MAAISRNIDLTENFDFGPRAGLFTGPLDSQTFKDIISKINDDCISMSVKDFDKIWRYESMFGKRIHKNEKYNIFHGINTYSRELELKELEDHCARCGVELRIPWKRKYDLCEKCSKETEKQESTYMYAGLKHFPWYRMVTFSINDEDSVKKTLFGLR